MSLIWHNLISTYFAIASSLPDSIWEREKYREKYITSVSYVVTEQINIKLLKSIQVLSQKYLLSTYYYVTGIIGTINADGSEENIKKSLPSWNFHSSEGSRDKHDKYSISRISNLLLNISGNIMYLSPVTWHYLIGSIFS